MGREAFFVKNKRKKKQNKTEKKTQHIHMRLKVTVFPLENVVSLIEGCKKEKKPFQASHSISHCRVGQSYHVMSSNDDAIKHMLSKFCATSQQQNYSNQSTVLF